MPVNARERLLASAQALFYREGVAQVGVERLVEHSGVGRASFYRHFAGKDDLVTAVVAAAGARWSARLAAAVAARPDDPLAMFDALEATCRSTDFRGCASINAMVELADPGSAPFRAAAENKRVATDMIRVALERCGQEPAGELAEDIALLMDGALVVSMRDRSGRPAERARELARHRLGEGR